MTPLRVVSARRAPAILTVAAAAWAVLVGMLLTFVPLGSSGVSTGLRDGTVIEETSHETLLSGEGPSILLVLAVPVVLTAVAVAGGLSRSAREARLVTGSLLFAGCVVAVASIGLFYAPAAIGLIIAGIATPRTRAHRHLSPTARRNASNSPR